MLRQHAGQQQRHLGIVGRLAGDRVPSASVGKFPDTVRVFPPDVIRNPKLDQAAKGVSCELASREPWARESISMSRKSRGIGPSPPFNIAIRPHRLMSIGIEN